MWRSEHLILYLNQTKYSSAYNEEDSDEDPFNIFIQEQSIIDKFFSLDNRLVACQRTASHFTTLFESLLYNKIVILYTHLGDYLENFKYFEDLLINIRLWTDVLLHDFTIYFRNKKWIIISSSFSPPLSFTRFIQEGTVNFPSWDSNDQPFGFEPDDFISLVREGKVMTMNTSNHNIVPAVCHITIEQQVSNTVFRVPYLTYEMLNTDDIYIYLQFRMFIRNIKIIWGQAREMTTSHSWIVIACLLFSLNSEFENIKMYHIKQVYDILQGDSVYKPENIFVYENSFENSLKLLIETHSKYTVHMNEDFEFGFKIKNTVVQFKKDTHISTFDFSKGITQIANIALTNYTAFKLHNITRSLQ